MNIVEKTETKESAMQNLNFFPNVHTVGEVKSLYRQLAKIHHPDVGGDLEMMKQLNAAYLEKLQSLDGQTRQGDDGKSYTYRYSEATEKAIMDKLQEILKAGAGKDWEVEIIGLWIWVGGTSRDDKDLLNKNGCKLAWHSKREKWYWKPYKSKTHYSSKSMDDLRNDYGSQTYSTETGNRSVATV